MKKEYDFWANKQNIPHLDLYTKLLKLFCGYTGLNFLLGFLYGKFWVDFQYNVLFLVLSIISFININSQANDSRKQERDKNAVVIEGIFQGVITLAICYMLSFWLLLVAYFLELVHVMIVIKRYYRFNKQ